MGREGSGLPPVVIESGRKSAGRGGLETGSIAGGVSGKSFLCSSRKFFAASMSMESIFKGDLHPPPGNRVL